MSDFVTIEDVRAPRERLKGLIAAIPCPHSETLSELTGSRLFVKLENLQMTGSFKERGAANVLAALVNKRVALEGETVVLLLGGGNIDVNLIARIIERGLVKDGRIVRLTVLLRDRPGALARLTALMAETRANVLHIGHDRAFPRARLSETEVELTLETSGPDHIRSIKNHLQSAGYTVEEVLHR